MRKRGQLTPSSLLTFYSNAVIVDVYLTISSLCLVSLAGTDINIATT